MVRKSAKDETESLNNHGPVAATVAHPFELDVILAGERDIPFCIRLAQGRHKAQRPCIVQINSANSDWKESTVFQRYTGLVVVNDQALIETNRIYFVTAFHNIDKQGNLLWLKKPSKMARNFIEQLHTLTTEKKLRIGDLVALKNAQRKYMLENLAQGIANVWYEDEDDTDTVIPYTVTTNASVERLSRTEIANALCRVKPASSLYGFSIHDIGIEANEGSASLEESLLSYLHNYSTIDYSHFRQTWLVKQVQRRCQSLGLPFVDDYVSYCQQNDSEWQLLEQTIFSQQPKPEVFAQTCNSMNFLFSQDVMRELIHKAPGLRVWTPHCATGEVAYGIVWAWHKAKMDKGIKLFATDPSQERINIAIQGLHTDCLEALELTQEKRELLGKQGKSLRSLPFLRKHITFSRHDLISLPDFSHLHLVHCPASLPAYKECEQQQILSVFNTCLVDGGILSLTDVELPEAQSLGFEPLAELPGIFRKVHGPTEPYNNKPLGGSAKASKRRFYAPPLPQLLNHHKKRNRYSEYHGALDRLIDKHMPAGLLIDELGNLVHTLGNVSAYAEPVKEGSYAVSVKKLLKPDLMYKLSPAIDRLLTQGRELHMTIPWNGGKEKKQLQVSLDYLPGSEAGVGFGAILFEEIASDLPHEGIAHYSQVEPHLRYIDKLENDISELREQESERVAELEEEVRALNKVIAEIAESNEQLYKDNRTLSAKLEALHDCYNQCRSVLSQGDPIPEHMPEHLVEDKHNNQRPNSAVAILDNELQLTYYNQTMARYFIGSNIGIGDNFVPMAELIGGEELSAAVQQCIQQDASRKLKLPGLITAEIVPLPNRELLVRVTETPPPKKANTKNHSIQPTV